MTEPRSPFVQEKFIDVETCKKIISIAEASPHFYANKEPKRHEVALDKLGKNAHDLLIPILRKAQGLVMEHFDEDSTLHHLDHSTISRVQPGGHVEYHADNVMPLGFSWQPNHTAWRTYSSMLYLSECHGGHLRLPYRNVEFSIEPGKLVGFPSSAEYFHGVEPVIAGVRWAVLIWFTKSDQYDLQKRLKMERVLVPNKFTKKEEQNAANPM